MSSEKQKLKNNTKLTILFSEVLVLIKYLKDNGHAVERFHVSGVNVSHVMTKYANSIAFSYCYNGFFPPKFAFE